MVAARLMRHFDMMKKFRGKRFFRPVVMLMEMSWIGVASVRSAL